MGPIRVLRNLVNKIGIAWWARVETNEPSVTYWFGPFLTRSSLKTNLQEFLQDLSSDGHESISHRLVRSRRNEPFTISY